MSVILYTNVNYTGISKQYPIGVYSTYDNVIANDSVQSVKIIGNCQVVLYIDINYTGPFIMINNSTPVLPTKFLKNVSSWKVTNSAPFVTLYDSENYLGNFSNYIVDRYTDYTGIGNDKVASIKFSDPQLQITLYNDINFSGKSLTYCNNIPSLPLGFTKSASSWIVFPTNVKPGNNQYIQPVYKPTN